MQVIGAEMEREGVNGQWKDATFEVWMRCMEFSCVSVAEDFSSPVSTRYWFWRYWKWKLVPYKRRGGLVQSVGVQLGSSQIQTPLAHMLKIEIWVGLVQVWLD